MVSVFSVIINVGDKKAICSVRQANPDTLCLFVLTVEPVTQVGQVSTEASSSAPTAPASIGRWVGTSAISNVLNMGHGYRSSSPWSRACTAVGLTAFGSIVC